MQDTHRNHPSQNGFTLIEVLVSLALFALISLAGVTLIETVIGVQERTRDRADRLAEMQRGLYLVTSDFEQLAGGLALDGSALSFIRGSASGDYQVAYRFAEGALMRATGGRERALLTGVGGADLRFFKDGAWVPEPVTEDSPDPPRAVELTLVLLPSGNAPGGTVRRVVELPEAP